MKRRTRLGSRIAEVHNGSSLSTRSTGQGEISIRRRIIANDWLDVIRAEIVAVKRNLRDYSATSSDGYDN